MSWHSDDSKELLEKVNINANKTLPSNFLRHIKANEQFKVRVASFCGLKACWDLVELPVFFADIESESITSKERLSMSWNKEPRVTLTCHVCWQAWYLLPSQTRHKARDQRVESTASERSEDFDTSPPYSQPWSYLAFHHCERKTNKTFLGSLSDHKLWLSRALHNFFVSRLLGWTSEFLD